MTLFFQRLCLAALALPVGVGPISLNALAQASESPKQIVLVAGRKSHGPEGNRIHDYPWSARLLKTLLEQSAVKDQVAVSTFFDGWPTNAEILARADTVMIISDGRDGSIGEEALHLATPETRETIQRLTNRGGGLVTFHFSTFAPDQFAEIALNWSGGYFDWETNGERLWFSAIDTLEATVSPASPQHPILRGVVPFRMREEFYYNIRFRPNDEGWQPIWSVADLPSARPNGKIVAWAVERRNGSRGFATTCGHYYDNWQHEGFRRTILNAILWTARIDIPDGGLDSDFVTREAISRHLDEGPVRTFEAIESADETIYKDEPYWYKPGHPSTPAETATITTQPGFVAERVLTVPPSLGSFTALATDAEGRLLAAAQHRPGIYRITPGPIGHPEQATQVESLGGVAKEFGWSHGLLAAFDSLYVTVSERNDHHPSGVYRLQDTNGDDQYDISTRLFELDAAGEHGPHNLVVHPDQTSLTLMCGNGTPLPGGPIRSRPTKTEGIDHLMPPGFESSRHTAAGWVMRFLPDGSQRELISSGLRNAFDLAYNRAGDLFTFDSDMEWDLGTPWYRPTRICHLVSGAEFGWRGGAAKWPEHYEDSMPPVINIGPASPTGVVFGYGTRFPEKYQNALFVCDWTFATIHAVHLHPKGASYGAKVEEFVGGVGLPVTDLVVGHDGALYMTVGGRRLGSAIYRIHHDPLIQDDPLSAPSSFAPEEAALHDLRRSLESFHGQDSPEAIGRAWPSLGHPDRVIRFAARVAIESQPVPEWQDRALEETDRATALTALLALVRQAGPQSVTSVLERLNQLPWEPLTPSETLRALRIIELGLARNPEPSASQIDAINQRLRPLFPSGDDSIDRELARLLCRLNAPSILDLLLDQMEADQGNRPLLGSGYFVRNPKYGKAVQDMLEAAPLSKRMHYAQMALWIKPPWSHEQTLRYFRLIGEARAHSRGGHHYLDFWNELTEKALDSIESIDPSSRERYESVLAATNSPLGEGLPAPIGPGRAWNLEEALELIAGGVGHRNRTNGRRSFDAAGCSLCHQINGHGGVLGPDLSTLGQRFTLRDILNATLNPSQSISDQYQVNTLVLKNGRSMSGRIVSRDNERTLIATDLMHPTRTTSVANHNIQSRRREPVSLMPSGLLDPLNEDELLDLLSFLIQSK